MIFISSPYGHSDPAIKQERLRIVCQYGAKLARAGRCATSPLIIGHAYVLHDENLPDDFNFWRQYCIETMCGCVEVHVLMIDGWKESLGVRTEIDFAELRNIPITYIHNW